MVVVDLPERRRQPRKPITDRIRVRAGVPRRHVIPPSERGESRRQEVHNAVSRMLWRRVVDAERRRGNGVLTTLVVGNEQAAATLSTMFANEPEAGHRVVGVCTPRAGPVRLRTYRAQRWEVIAANGGDPLFFNVKDDPRITGAGRVLRKFSIDELPQLFNVLLDDMSIVGPRPQVRREVDSYDEPGLTGLWQISGRSDLRVEDVVRLDLAHIENWSPIRDLMIIAKTVKTVLTGDGAH